MSDTTFRPPIPEKSPPATAEDDPWFEEASDGETHPMNPAARALVGDTPAPLVTWLVEEDRAVAEGALRIGLPADARFSMAPSQWWWLRPRSRRADGSRRINCIDVTARRAAEASGRRGAIDRVLSALDDLSDAFVIYDNSGHLIVCNRRFRDLYGYSEEEARPGVHFRQLGQIDIERGNVQVPPGMDPSTYLDRKAQYRRELKGTFQVRLKDGRWLETRDRRTADGGFVSIQADITDRRRAEDALVQAKERAEQALKDVAEAHAQLEQFAYVASHDLREPLRMVTAYLDLLERRCAKMLDDDGREFIAHARGGAKRMDALILDLLAYTRVGRCDQADTTVDMAALLAAVRANLDLAVRETGAEIISPTALPSVTGSEPELTSLLQNLLGNALKYHHPDRRPRIVLSATTDAMNGRAHFVVTDNGIGIPSEYHDRIFQIFQRLHPRDAYSGTGMGLALCRKIVERHGGRITVASTPGQGSSFSVDLPLAKS